MNFRTLKSLFEAGGLSSATVCPAPMATGWVILVTSADKRSRERLTTTNKKEDKVFKNVQSALEDARRIGFRSVQVELPDDSVKIRK